MKYVSNLSAGIEKAESKKGLFLGDKMNPKDRKTTMFGNLNMVYYVQEKANLSPKITSHIFRRPTRTDNTVIESEFITKPATIKDVIKYCRVSEQALRLIGFIGANRFEDPYGNFVIEIETESYGNIKLMTFPDTKSNVGVFMNKQGETSYVADGRCYILNDKVYLISTNQTALMEFIKLKNENPESRISLSRIISKEMWQIKDEEDENNNEEVIKSIMWLGYTKYCNFPVYNGEYYNTIWSEDKNNNLFDICSKTDLRKYINYSSLAQTGVAGVCGPLVSGLVQHKEQLIDRYGNPKLDGQGNPVTRTLWLLETGEITKFIGTKGKLDVMANQGNKVYKQDNYQGRCLVVLAELKPNGYEYAINMSGNCLATKEAAMSYLSNMTRDKANDCHMNLPAHKIFIKSNGKPVRVKGATSTVELLATDMNGKILTDRVVVLPPREFNPDGSIDEDYGKFEHLCKYRDKESNLQMVKLYFEDKVYEVPGLFCDVYEDAMHSAVTSLKIDVQNLDYYGAIAIQYALNGKTNLKKAMVKRLDHAKLGRAMSIAKIGRAIPKVSKYEDFINNL